MPIGCVIVHEGKIIARGYNRRNTDKVEDMNATNVMGVICGVTTNPSLIAKEGRDFKEVIKEITSIVDLSLIHI